MKSAPQRPIFVSVNIKQKYMKLILRLGLILFTGFISISTASAQLYGTADTNAPELRVPTSVKPACDYWMRDTWATLGPDGYYYITGTTSTPVSYTHLDVYKRQEEKERTSCLVHCSDRVRCYKLPEAYHRWCSGNKHHP